MRHFFPELTSVWWCGVAEFLLSDHWSHSQCLCLPTAAAASVTFISEQSCPNGCWTEICLNEIFFNLLFEKQISSLEVFSASALSLIAQETRRGLVINQNFPSDLRAQLRERAPEPNAGCGGPDSRCRL